MGEIDANDRTTPPLPWERDEPVLRVETPEQVEILLPLAPLGTRLLAALVDYTFLAVINVIAFVILLVLFLTGDAEGDIYGFLIAAASTVSFLFNIFYFVGFELRGEGQTPGKKLMGIRTVLTTGQGITPGASMIRNLARVVDTFPVLWLVPVLDESNRRLGDFAAGTLVVNLAPASKPPPRFSLGDSYAALSDKRFLLSGDLYSKLSEQDYNLLEFFFSESRKVTSPRKRNALARAIAGKYLRRLNLEAQAQAIAESPFRFLQELYLFLRDRYSRHGF